MIPAAAVYARAERPKSKVVDFLYITSVVSIILFFVWLFQLIGTDYGGRFIFGTMLQAFLIPAVVLWGVHFARGGNVKEVVERVKQLMEKKNEERKVHINIFTLVAGVLLILGAVAIGLYFLLR
jgi:hypothetical protein